MRGLFGKTGALNTGQPVNLAHPLNRGLVSWWQAIPQGAFFGGARLLDLMGKNHGTLTGGTLWTGASGRPGGWGSLSGDGSDDHVATPIEYTTLGSAWSLGGWLRRDGDASGGDGNDVGFSVGRNTYLTILGRWQQDTGGFPFTGCPTLGVGAWTHIVVTSTGSGAGNTKIYHNGVQVDGGQDGGVLSTGNVMLMGQHTGSARRHLGLLDDFVVYSRVLSASEVWNRYEESRRGNPTTLNYIQRATVFDLGGGAPPAGNRRRRLLICGVAA